MCRIHWILNCMLNVGWRSTTTTTMTIVHRHRRHRKTLGINLSIIFFVQIVRMCYCLYWHLKFFFFSSLILFHHYQIDDAFSIIIVAFDFFKQADCEWEICWQHISCSIFIIGRLFWCDKSRPLKQNDDSFISFKGKLYS